MPEFPQEGLHPPIELLHPPRLWLSHAQLWSTPRPRWKNFWRSSASILSPRFADQITGACRLDFEGSCRPDTLTSLFGGIQRGARNLNHVLVSCIPDWQIKSLEPAGSTSKGPADLTP